VRPKVGVECVEARSILWFHLDVVLTTKPGVFNNGRYTPNDLPDDSVAHATDINDLGEIGREIVTALFSNVVISHNAEFVAIEPQRFGIGLLGDSDGELWRETLPRVARIIRVKLRDPKIRFIASRRCHRQNKLWLEGLLMDLT
jgi:hypothetical protein